MVVIRAEYSTARPRPAPAAAPASPPVTWSGPGPPPPTAVAWAVIRIMTFFSTLVTSLVWTHRKARTLRTSHPWLWSWLSWRMFHANMGSTYCWSIQPSNCILRVSSFFKLHKGEARRVSGHPHLLQGTIIAEGTLQLLLWGLTWEVSHIHLTIKLIVSGHTGF